MAHPVLPSLLASLAAALIAVLAPRPRTALVATAAVTAAAATGVGPSGAQGVLAYLGLAVGPIATEELAPILAGIAASEGKLALAPALVVMTLGGWVATALLYGFGRWRGRWVRRRFPRAGRAIKGLLRAVRRRPWRSAFAVRYAFGARLLLPLACGAAHVRPDVYLAGSLVSSVTWTLLFTYVGLWFGQAALRALDTVREYDSIVGGVAAGFAVLAFLVVRRRRQLAAARASEPPLPSPGGPAR